MNSGTKDVGRDPNWDFSKGEYKEETGYARIRGQFLAASDEDLKKHESKLVSSVFCSRRRIRNLPKYVVHRHAGIIRQRSRKEQLSAVQQGRVELHEICENAMALDLHVIIGVTR